MILAVDFDGTVVMYDNPTRAVPGAVEHLREFCKLGIRLVLWTCRYEGELREAVAWLTRRGIVLHGANEHPQWCGSPKIWADLYIDDKAFGVPLVTPDMGRPYVDWSVAGPGILSHYHQFFGNG